MTPALRGGHALWEAAMILLAIGACVQVQLSGPVEPWIIEVDPPPAAEPVVEIFDVVAPERVDLLLFSVGCGGIPNGELAATLPAAADALGDLGVDARWELIVLEDADCGPYPALDAIAVALDTPGTVREGSVPHALLVSEAADASHLAPDEFVALWSALGAGQLSVAADPEGGAPWFQVAEATGGIASDLVDAELGRLVPEVGVAALALPSSWPLSDLPQRETLEVSVRIDGVALRFDPDEIVYDERANSAGLVDFVPPAGAVVEIRYLPARM